MTERERIRAEIWKYVSLPWPIDPAFWTDKLTDAIVAALDAGSGVGRSVEWLDADERRNLRAWCDAADRYFRHGNVPLTTEGQIGWIRRLLDQADDIDRALATHANARRHAADVTSAESDQHDVLAMTYYNRRDECMRELLRREAALDAGRGVGLSDEEHDYFVAALAQYGDRHGPSEIANAVLAKVTDALAAGEPGETQRREDMALICQWIDDVCETWVHMEPNEDEAFQRISTHVGYVPVTRRRGAAEESD